MNIIKLERAMSATYYIAQAIDHLAAARDCLAEADAPRALEKVRRALKSAEGAKRNAEGRENRALADTEVVYEWRTEAELIRDAKRAHFAKTITE